MSFKIRTNEPNGLLLYNNGAPHAQVFYYSVFTVRHTLRDFWPRADLADVLLLGPVFVLKKWRALLSP